MHNVESSDDFNSEYWACPERGHIPKSIDVQPTNVCTHFLISPDLLRNPVLYFLNEWQGVFLMKLITTWIFLWI